MYKISRFFNFIFIAINFKTQQHDYFKSQKISFIKIAKFPEKKQQSKENI